jgi:hypothetical protein
MSLAEFLDFRLELATEIQLSLDGNRDIVFFSHADNLTLTNAEK